MEGKVLAKSLAGGVSLMSNLVLNASPMIDNGTCPVMIPFV